MQNLPSGFPADQGGISSCNAARHMTLLVPLADATEPSVEDVSGYVGAASHSLRYMSGDSVEQQHPTVNT